MKKITFSTVLLLLTISLHAQEKDSIQSKMNTLKKIVNNQFPSTRFLDVQYEQLSSSDYETKLNDHVYETGTIESEKRVRIATNFPIIKKDKWAISSSLRYSYRSIDFADVKVPSGGNPILGREQNQVFHYFYGSLNYTRYDKLFGKTYVSNISVFGDASDENFGMLNATYIGSLVLKKNEQTTMTIGLVLQTNPNSVFPILPAFSYKHQFENSPWQVDIVLPKQIYFRRPLLAKGRLSLGTVFEGEPFYFNTNLLGTGETTYNFNRNEIKTGLVYEYKLSNEFIASFRTGYNYYLNGTIRERGKTKEISQTTFDPNFYVNLGLSLNLFD